MDIFEAIFTRRSIRKYTDALVSQEDITLLLSAAMSAPSAGNAQPWRFIVVQAQAQRDAIARLHPYAQMAPKAPLCIAVCADTQAEKYPGFWPQDCSAAIQNLMLAARGKGIGTVWTGIYPIADRVAAFQELFKLPEHIIPLGVVVVGYPDQPFTEHNRYDAQKVRFETWKNSSAVY